MTKNRWQQLNDRIIACRACPRLIEHCEQIGTVKRRAYQACEYWAGPVPNFGPMRSKLLIVGLAPGAHGANRTGRMFTGDRSGDWLYRALHRGGFASQAESSSRDDGLRLTNCVITAICHCAPPANKPTATEQANCAPWLQATFDLVRPRVLLALGKIAWDGTLRHMKAEATPDQRKQLQACKFRHGAEYQLPSGIWLIGSYHPSQQNTFTGRLTEAMLDDVVARARKLTK